MLKHLSPCGAEGWEPEEAEMRWLGGQSTRWFGARGSVSTASVPHPSPLHTLPMINQPYHCAAEAKGGRKGGRERRG